MNGSSVRTSPEIAIKESLGGQHLLVLMLEYPPFLYIDRHANGSKTYRGICWDLIVTVSAALNFTFTLDQPKDGQWGYKDPVTGWSGIQGEVFRGEADLGMPMTVTPERAVEFDFSFSFWQETCGTVVRLESDGALDLWFLRPLSHSVWLALLVAYVITSLCLWGLPALSNRLASTFNKTHQPSWTLPETLWYAMGTVFNQGGKRVSSPAVWRCIAISWWYTMLILVNVYVGNLVAFTATREYRPPFNTLQEMVNQQEYEYGIEQGIFIEKLFKNAPVGVYKQIGEYITTNNDSFTKNTATGIHRAMSSKYAFMGELSPLSASIVEYCNVTLMKEEFYSGRWAFTSRKGWKHLEELDQITMKLVEGGMIEMWRQKHWPVSSCRGQGTFAAFSPVNLYDVATVFAVLLSGIGIALVLLIGENIMMVHVQKTKLLQ